MRDEINGHDDVVGDAGEILRIGISDEDAVRGAIPEGLAAELLHHHLIWKPDETALDEEGVDVLLGRAALVNLRLGGDNRRNAPCLYTLKSDHVTKGHILRAETQQVFRRDGMPERELVATVVILLIHHEAETILVGQLENVVTPVLVPDMMLSLRGDLDTGNDVISGELPQNGYLLIE